MKIANRLPGYCDTRGRGPGKGLNKAKSQRRNVALEVEGRILSPLKSLSNDDIAYHYWGVKREADLFPDNFLPTP